MDVAELVAVLGLAIDEADWARGQELIERTRHGVEHLSEARREGAEKEGEEAKSLRETLEKGLETFVGYEGIKSIAEMVEHTVEATVQAKHLGERLGITTEAVQSLGYAASVTGISTSVLTNGLQRLSFGLQATSARAGMQGAAQAIQQLHLNVGELKKLPLDKQLAEIADKFKGMEDGAKKNALAMQIFGRTAGPQMIPLLNKGSEGIAEMREEAELLGVTMGEESVEKVEEFERAQKRLQARFGAIKDAIVLKMLPAFEELANGLSRVVKFFNTHQAALDALLGGIAAAIAYVGYTAAVAWAAVLGPFALFVAAAAAITAIGVKLADVWEGGLSRVKKILIALGILLTSVLGLTLGPILLIASGIVLLIRHAKEVEEVFEGVGEAIGDAFEAAYDWVRDKGEAVFDWIERKIEFLERRWEDVKGIFEQVGGSVLDVQGGKFVVPQAAGPSRAAPEPFAAGGGGPGPGGGTHVEVNNYNTIHTGASEEAVTKAMDKHQENTMRHTMAALKKGG